MFEIIVNCFAMLCVFHHITWILVTIPLFSCTGPDKRISSGGCNACEMAVKVGGVITCLPPSTSQCLLGYHLMVMSSSVYGGGKVYIYMSFCFLTFAIIFAQILIVIGIPFIY